MKTILKPNHDESPMEALARAASWLEHNPESLLQDLPSVEACLDLFNLISNVYDVSLFEEVLDVIPDGNPGPEPLAAFVVKWGLSKKWTFPGEGEPYKSIRAAIRKAKPEVSVVQDLDFLLDYASKARNALLTGKPVTHVDLDDLDSIRMRLREAEGR